MLNVYFNIYKIENKFKNFVFITFKFDRKVYIRNFFDYKMLDKFLKEAVSIVAGKTSEDIVDYLDDKKYVNEFIIAKKLDITINQARNILYKLSDFGLVSSTRKKDKRKGWYTYFWKIETIKCLEFLKENITKKFNQIKNQVESRETKTFYVCESCHVEYNEENALLHDFTCPECGRILVVKDNTKLLKELKKNQEKQLKEISMINELLAKERESANKIREKENRKEFKKAEKKRKKDRIERKRIRDKLKPKHVLPSKKDKKNLKKKHKKSGKKMKRI